MSIQNNNIFDNENIDDDFDIKLQNDYDNDYDNNEQNQISDIPASLLKRYIPSRILGAGSFGIVWLAQDTFNLRHYVAIKVVELLDEEQQSLGIDDTIFAELSILSRLDHPNIIKMLQVEYDISSKMLAIVFELANYGDLEKLIYKQWFQGTDEEIVARRDIKIPEQLQITYDIFCGVNYLHINNIIHLDLKPENILINRDDNKDNNEYKNNVTETNQWGNFQFLHAKVADFGLSIRKDGYKRPGYEESTATYRSPEKQCGSRYDQTTDIWSIGVILCEIFFKKELFNENLRREIELFPNIVSKIGTPSRQWVQEYRQARHQCPILTRLQQSQYLNIETTIFKGNFDEIAFFRDRYYGPEFYGQILELISRCLRYEPQERITFEQVVELPLFKNTPLCDCQDCIRISSYHTIKNAPPLNPIIEQAVDFHPEIILPYAREVYRRFIAKRSDLENSEDQEISQDELFYQCASISIAAKFLDFSNDAIMMLREKLLQFAQIPDFNTFNMLELDIANTLGWNFD